MGLEDLKKTILQEYRNLKTYRSFNPFLADLSEDEAAILKKLETTGYAVIENYFSPLKCKEFQKEIDNIIDRFRDKIWTDKALSDHRIFGADRVSEKIRTFYEDPFINRIMYVHQNAKVLNGYVLGARMEYKPDNEGSGGGWHRDRPDCRQTKAIIYLSDVDETNGPFQYIEKSHASKFVIKDLWKYNFPHNKARFADNEVNRIIQDRPEKLKTFTAKAGTLLLVDTRGIHRGMPIQAGFRYALTTYNWPHEIPAHMKAEMVTSKM